MVHVYRLAQSTQPGFRYAATALLRSAVRPSGINAIAADSLICMTKTGLRNAAPFTSRPLVVAPARLAVRPLVRLHKRLMDSLVKSPQ